MAVHVEGAGHLGGAARVGQAQGALAGGVQDTAVGQDGHGHRLAGLLHALGEGDLLEGGGGGGLVEGLRVGGAGGERGQAQ